MSDPTLILAFAIVGALILGAFIEIVSDLPPAQRCQHCGKKLGPDHIPQHTRDLMRSAGLSSNPTWYVGPLICPHYERKTTLADLAEQARKGATAPQNHDDRPAGGHGRERA